MKEKLKLLSPVLLLVALLTTAVCLLVFESEYLWRVQELNLFLDTPLFLKQQMVASGWLLTWLGCYFTEFFYHQWLGVTLLTLWWALMLWMIARTFSVPMKWSLVLLIPLAAVVLMNVDLGYWLYYLKLRGHFFAAAIGTTLAVGSVWLFRLLPDKYLLRPVYVAVATGVLYPLIGFYALVAALLMGVLAWRLDGTLASRLTVSAVALIAIGVWPLFYYNYVFYQTNLLNIYWTGIPIFTIEKQSIEYYIPYYLLVVSLAGLALMYRRWCTGDVEKPLKWGICQVALLAVTVFGVQHFWYKDYNFHKELRMLQCAEQGDWNGVLKEAAVTEDEPTRSVVMMKNLALFRQGRQGDDMYRYRTGAKVSTTEIPLRMAQVVGRCIYFNYGQLNFCYRWCLEDGVEFGWRVEYLKYLVRCGLANGDNRVVRKYLALLKHTRYHREWAEHYERFLNDRKTLLADKEFSQMMHLTKTEDMLASDNSLVEHFLMNQFIINNSTDSVYKEQALISALWMKDIPTFWPRFFAYAQIHTRDHMPTHYQEAAYLYGQLEKTVDVSRMPFDEQVKRDYAEFMAMAQRCQGMSNDQMRELFYPRFGHTFYFEYFLVRNQKLY